jgi:hypothetical protein
MYRPDHDEVHAEYSVIEQRYNIYMFRIEDNKRYQVTNMELDELEPGLQPYSPQISLDSTDAQILFDDLWRAGLRPSTKDETPAKDEHIRDLRMIAFHALGMTK